MLTIYISMILHRKSVVALGQTLRLNVTLWGIHMFIRNCTLAAALILLSTTTFAATSQDIAKRAILANKSRMFKDPDSIRDASIGAVAACPSGNGDCVCIELNARNSMGGMSGLQTVGVRINGLAAEAFGQMADTSECGKMVPFPALNGRGR
ncbi:hypothetical protein [Bradyrhizobium sp. 131]|uniref:hypothetical protein n=1 Tax=Bradyrhizobium sp. 131 TaxID=2782609 RepID=UPI001FFF90C5|nr:hypothetical protein [Bradyrhizobium sp. 131]UPK16099.1 hypothetical protein IVA73_18070 [Bradyrhizobium sp. 131]